MIDILSRKSSADDTLIFACWARLGGGDRGGLCGSCWGMQEPDTNFILYLYIYIYI